MNASPSPSHQARHLLPGSGVLVSEAGPREIEVAFLVPAKLLLRMAGAAEVVRHALTLPVRRNSDINGGIRVNQLLIADIRAHNERAWTNSNSWNLLSRWWRAAA